MEFRDWLDRDMFLEDTDDALVKRVADGDMDALGELLQKWQGPLTRYVAQRVANRHDVEEIVQKVMLNIVKAMQSGKTKVENFKNWAYKITHNAIASHYRKEKPTTLEEPEEAHISSSGKKMGRIGLPIPSVTMEGDPFGKATEKEEKVLIQQVLADWDKGTPYQQKQARMIRMRFFGQMKLSEIATELGEPLGTVKRVVHVGIKNLEKDLREKGVEE